MKESENIKIKLLRFIGIAYFVLGAIALLYTSRRITGFSVFEGISGAPGLILGVVLIVIGIFVLISSRRNKDGAV